jgi:zinc transport system substrate-binding protein
LLAPGVDDTPDHFLSMTNCRLARLISALGFGLSFAGTGALAEVPKVATDIPPVHSLVSQVMGEMGEPDLIVSPGTTPHGFAMRPSQARVLHSAEIVCHVGHGWTPRLEHALRSVAKDTVVITLSESPGTLKHRFRSGPSFDPHPRKDEDNHQSERGYVVTDQSTRHDKHNHENGDPHMRLDPENARRWLDTIAAELSEIDPENAARYRLNAQTRSADLAHLTTILASQLSPVSDQPFLVLHDAFHYFEHRFEIEATGTVSPGDTASPGPARITRIRNIVRERDIACVFTEPQLRSSLVPAVLEGSRARIGILDPLGASLRPGPDLYPQLLQKLADSLVDCLGH